MKNILVTTDLSENSVQALEIAKKLTITLTADLTVLSIFQDPTAAAVVISEVPIITDPEVITQLREQSETELNLLVNKHLEGLKPKIEIIASTSGDTAQDIVDYAKTNNNDLIIIATHGRTGIARILIGSIAEKVVRLAPCPVLTVRHS